MMLAWLVGYGTKPGSSFTWKVWFGPCRWFNSTGTLGGASKQIGVRVQVPVQATEQVLHQLCRGGCSHRRTWRHTAFHGDKRYHGDAEGIPSLPESFLLEGPESGSFEMPQPSFHPLFSSNFSMKFIRIMPPLP